jgi:addiction module HigA family antidote
MYPFDPPHPGEIIAAAMAELNIGVRQLATAMEVSPSAVSRLLSRKRDVSPELALRLSRVLGSSAETWLKMQIYFNLHEAAKNVDVSRLEPVKARSYDEIKRPFGPRALQ